MKYLGSIDIGGTKTMVGIVDSDAKILVKRQFTTYNADFNKHFSDCYIRFNECLSELKLTVKDLDGIGVNMPGMVDESTGILLHAPFAGWYNINVKEYFSCMFGTEKVFVENDVNSCAIGELIFGNACDNYLWATVSTGIGGAVIIDRKNSLWIAKFPGNSDDRDTGAWEKTLSDMAAAAGIDVPETKVVQFSKKGHTFLSRRFDRDMNGRRIHFASAMTLLGHEYSADYSTGISYLDIMQFICRCGINIEKNLEELWRRMVFNIAVSNCDDHLRNHGFILKNRGWELSPAYDMNPEPDGTGLKLNITQDDNSLDFELAMSVIKYYRISAKRAGEILNQVKKAVGAWRKIASGYNISKTEQELVAGAFRV